MAKAFVGPQLRQLRRVRKLTQAEMARALGVSAGYVNLLENNQRSLSVRMLMAIADTYQVDWRDLVRDETSSTLAELRTATRDPMFPAGGPELDELRAAIDHAPRLVRQFLHLYGLHRRALERIMRQGTAGAPERLLASSAEAVIHDFFRDHSNHFPELESAAEALLADENCEPDDLYAALKGRLSRLHGIRVERRAVEEVPLLARIPLDPLMREAADDGAPVAEVAPDCEAAVAIAALAESVAASRAGTIRKPLTVLS